ncbi:MAG: DUF1858 domain-containing protein [Lachnospiraceae bacterium]|nr:DUF1858 domain-containing protein [Lachnospiraceae bacterium]
MVEITKDMLIGDIIQAEPKLAAVLMMGGMHCIGCPASQGESLEEACMVHGIDSDEMLSEIQKFLVELEEKEKEEAAKA